MANLQKDLENYTSYKKDVEENEIKEATLLLEQSNDESIEILEKLNINHEYQDAKKQVDRKNALKHLSKLYNKNVYTYNDIYKICKKYGLLFTKISNYKGKIPENMVKDIKDFSKKHNISVSIDNFFVMMPFELIYSDSYKHFKDNYKPCLFYIERGLNSHGRPDQYDKFILLENYSPNFNSSRIIGNLFKNKDNSLRCETLKEYFKYLYIHRILLSSGYLLSLFMLIFGNLFFFSVGVLTLIAMIILTIVFRFNLSENNIFAISTYGYQ